MSQKAILGIFVFIISIGLLPMLGYAQKPAGSASDGKSLEEILEEEKKRKYAKIDDFLKDFDKGFEGDMGEKFDDLLKEDEFLENDDESNTDDFETFNREFDKIIEEDLADFELFEIDADSLDDGLIISETPASAPAPPSMAGQKGN